jgi:enoyl-CoA hydratase/carnithine racemase
LVNSTSGISRDSVRVEIRRVGDVAVVAVRIPPVNALSRPVREALLRNIWDAANDTSILGQDDVDPRP